MDQTIDYAAFPTTLLVIAALVATVVIIRFVIKTLKPMLPTVRRETLRPTWSPSQGKYVYVPTSQIHNITSVRPRTR